MVNKLEMLMDLVKGDNSMQKKRIFDKNINFENYATFKECEILGDRKGVKFIMANNISYDVPLSLLKKWFKEPHYYFEKNKMKNFNPKAHKTSNKEKVLKVRRVLKNTALRIYLTDGAVYDVAWDVVLMACEPLYEHYRGVGILNS